MIAPWTEFFLTVANYVSYRGFPAPVEIIKIGDKAVRLGFANLEDTRRWASMLAPDAVAELVGLQLTYGMDFERYERSLCGWDVAVQGTGKVPVTP